jgi:hypothetical protein
MPVYCLFVGDFYLTAILGNLQPLFRHPFWRSAELVKEYDERVDRKLQTAIVK